MTYSYRILREVIKRETLPSHDCVVEGGIGNNFHRFHYFREQGYSGIYLGINLERPNIPIPDGLIHVVGDCFDANFVSSLLDKYEVNNPIFVSNGALSDSLLRGYYSTHVEEATKTLTLLFKKQLHLRPTGKFPITRARIYFPTDKDNENSYYRKFMEFLAECRKRGWNEDVVERNIVLLKHE